VGLSSGRLDALVFVLGLLIGTTLFAISYGSALRSLMAIGEIIDGDTFTDAYGISEVALLGILGLALVGVFYLGSWFERRSAGPLSAQSACSEQQ
jgi:hypothetical protein